MLAQQLIIQVNVCMIVHTVEQQLVSGTLQVRPLQCGFIDPPTVFDPLAFQTVQFKIGILDPACPIQRQCNTARHLTVDPGRNAPENLSGFHTSVPQRNVGIRSFQSPFFLTQRIAHSRASCAFSFIILEDFEKVNPRTREMSFFLEVYELFTHRRLNFYIIRTIRLESAGFSVYFPETIDEKQKMEYDSIIPIIPGGTP